MEKEMSIEEEEYYEDHIEEIALEKIEKGEWLTEHDVKLLVCDYQVDSEYRESHRWVTDVTSIVRLKKDIGNNNFEPHYYSLSWSSGKTECQEDEFWEQPAIEVEQVEKVITIKEWVPIKKS